MDTFLPMMGSTSAPRCPCCPPGMATNGKWRTVSLLTGTGLRGPHFGPAV